MKSYLVRAATPDDAPAIARVHVDTWRAAYAGLIPQEILDGLSVERREEFWRSVAETPGEHRLVVAEAGGRVVGFGSTGPARDEDLPHGSGELMAIYVEPAAWDKGHGARLLRHTVADLRSRGLDPLVLWVLTENGRGRRFYEAMGWRPDGGARSIDFGGTSIEEVRYRPADAASASPARLPKHARRKGTP